MIRPTHSPSESTSVETSCVCARQVEVDVKENVRTLGHSSGEGGRIIVPDGRGH